MYCFKIRLRYTPSLAICSPANCVLKTQRFGLLRLDFPRTEVRKTQRFGLLRLDFPRTEARKTQRSGLLCLDFPRTDVRETQRFGLLRLDFPRTEPAVAHVRECTDWYLRRQTAMQHTNDG